MGGCRTFIFMSNEPDSTNTLLELVARQFLSYSFLLKSWMRSSDAKIVSDGEKIVAVNEEVSATFGYHPSELIGNEVDMLVPEGVRPQHKTHRQGYKSHPKNRPMYSGATLKARHKDGTEFPAVIDLLYNTEPNETLIEASIRRVDD